MTAIEDTRKKLSDVLNRTYGSHVRSPAGILAVAKAAAALDDQQTLASLLAVVDAYADGSDGSDFLNGLSQTQDYADLAQAFRIVANHQRGEPFTFVL